MGLVVADPGLLTSAIVRSATIVFGEDAYPDLATKVTEGSTILSELSDWFAARATTVPTH